MWRRSGADAVEVLLVHRPRYDDWTFPKGKLVAGEESLAGALREVEEETGYRCQPGLEVEGSRYPGPDGRPKVVRYWEMTPISGSFVANSEVDRLLWAGTAEVEGILTYARDAAVLASFIRVVGIGSVE